LFSEGLNVITRRTHGVVLIQSQCSTVVGFVEVILALSQSVSQSIGKPNQSNSCKRIKD